MTADELRKMLDRFLKAIGGLDAEAISPNRLHELDQVWRDLNNHCAMMEEAERECIADGEVAVIPPAMTPAEVRKSHDTRSILTGELLSPPPESVRGSATEHNAEAIDKLQARVCQLEGTVKAFIKTTAEAFEMVDDGETYRAMSRVDKLIEGLWVEQQDRAVLADGTDGNVSGGR